MVVVEEDEADGKAVLRLTNRLVQGLQRMRRSIFLVIMVLTGAPVFAAPRSAPSRVTVAELKQFLEEQQAARVSDTELAQKLSGVELSEQLTEFRLAQLKAELRLGEKAARELDLLADLTAFLNPPASEVSGHAPPGAEATREMIHAAQHFAAVTLRSLPDFVAARTTWSFEDVPIRLGNKTAQSGMHPMSTDVSEVGFRHGLEYSTHGGGAPEPGSGRKVSLMGLSSAGEFGPVLATIMSDSARGGITWSYWQETSSGSIAVLGYKVPAEDSHYLIDICCAKNPDTNEELSYRGTPAYSGFISIDPTTGDVLRLTLEAKIYDWDPPPSFGLLVSYGEVQVNGRSLICPLRSAVTLNSSWTEHKRTWDDTYVNDVVFSNYRRFGSTAKIATNSSVH